MSGKGKYQYRISRGLDELPAHLGSVLSRPLHMLCPFTFIFTIHIHTLTA